MLSTKVKICLCFLLAGMGLYSQGQFARKSPGTSIEEAARASAKNPKETVPVEVVPGLTVNSDLKGFSIKSYAEGIMRSIRGNWYAVIRESVADAEKRKGQVVVAFTVLRDGSVTDIRVVNSSGEDDLDNSAVEGLRRAAPLAPLPQGLQLEELQLRFHFKFIPAKKWSRIR